MEFAHLDEFCIEGAGRQTPDVITHAPEAAERYARILESGKPMLGFAAHLANWELPAVVAKALVPQSAVLYRRPNIRPISDVIVKLRAPLMGDLVAAGIDAPVKLARLSEAGVHVGMLVDQHFSKGVDVIFFGRRCRANPLIAMLGAANRTADLRAAPCAQARRQQLLGRDHRSDRSGTRCRRPHRDQGHHADDHVSD